MKAVIYARISRTDDKHNTDRQLYDLNNYAKANSIEVVRIFTEKVTGAKTRKDRPVLNECLVFCVSQKIDILLLNALDRLGRNTDDILKNIMFCKESGLNVYFQKEQFSIFTPDGKPHPFLMIFIAVLGTIAEMERENIKFRLQSGLNKYIADGGKMGRTGYRKSKAPQRPRKLRPHRPPLQRRQSHRHHLRPPRRPHQSPANPQTLPQSKKVAVLGYLPNQKSYNNGEKARKYHPYRLEGSRMD